MTAEKIQSKTYTAKAILCVNMRISLTCLALGYRCPQNDSEKPSAEVWNLSQEFMRNTGNLHL